MQYQYNKIDNLKLAIKNLNHLIIEPGQILSFWKMVGRPSRLKGYKMGFTLNQGKIQPGIGGGLCQLSNLIYWMTLHTPLTILERYRHSYDVFPDENRTLPFGSGATVSYNYIDLQIQNTTAQNFQLHLEVTDTYLEGEWLSDYAVENKYEIIEEGHRIQHEINGIYSRHNSLCRITRNTQNQILKKETITENHALMMYSPLLANQTENNQAYGNIQGTPVRG
jgi:vancomycin resistance protein VanW